MEEVLQVGKWLEFDAGTCFGAKFHFGIIMGIDYEKHVVVVAVNATSQVEKLIMFADLHGIPVEDAMVDVTSDLRFSKPTGIDCHRPREVSLEQLQHWVQRKKIRKSSYNEDVSAEIMNRIVGIMSRSPLVEKAIKEIVQKSSI